MTLTAETILALKASPFSFSLTHRELSNAYDIARLSGDHQYVKLILTDDALFIRSDVDGLECASNCKITPRPSCPNLSLAVNMPRSVLQVLADKDTMWESLQCKIELADDLSSETGSITSTTWTFEYGHTHVMCPADVISFPDPLASSAALREVSAEALCQSLRLLKPFIDPESKKNQFTSAFVHNGGAQAAVASHARLISDKRLVWPGVYIGGRQINDLVYVLSRLAAPVSVADEGGYLLFQAINGSCRVQTGSVSVDATQLKSLSWLCSIELPTLDVNNAIQTICSQATKKEAVVRVSAGPSHEAYLTLATDVHGGQARLRMPLPSALPVEIDLTIAAASLMKLCVASVGTHLHLQFGSNCLAATQDDGELSILTLIAGNSAPTRKA